MNPYNVCINSCQDDTDVTIINHSFLYNQNDEPIGSCLPVLRRHLQPTAPSKEQISSNYVYVDHDRIEIAKQLEQIVDYYRKELKQEPYNQFECNQQLITRLIDLIRPIYSSNKQKIKDLDVLLEDVSHQHEKRSAEQKERNDQQQNQIRHLKKSLVSTSAEDNIQTSLMNDLYRINAVVDYEQWMQIDEETKKLHDLIKTQSNQINTIIELLSAKDIIKNDKPTCSNWAGLNSTIQKCPICEFEFLDTITDDNINQHMETCLISSGLAAENMSIEPKQLACPFCSQQQSYTGHLAYLDHLSKCCNDIPDTD
ncbi:unnamed protein product [Adineta ricciae]|uniref:Uncharacterized protein n=1 Tax=Adineta ricciae TaxID=249248 RepID=A0A813X7F2_ADIRI|nr:unnamed protein product [Adineta ricciae]